MQGADQTEENNENYSNNEGNSDAPSSGAQEQTSSEGLNRWFGLSSQIAKGAVDAVKNVVDYAPNRVSEFMFGGLQIEFEDYNELHIRSGKVSEITTRATPNEDHTSSQAVLTSSSDSVSASQAIDETNSDANNKSESKEGQKLITTNDASNHHPDNEESVDSFSGSKSSFDRKDFDSENDDVLPDIRRLYEPLPEENKIEQPNEEEGLCSWLCGIGKNAATSFVAKLTALDPALLIFTVSGLILIYSKIEDNDDVSTPCFGEIAEGVVVSIVAFWGFQFVFQYNGGPDNCLEDFSLEPLYHNLITH